jgi:alkylation response protein AidB-like acyl-CoA dehydrogenase
MVGPARRAAEQAALWARTRFQFGRPLADFEQIRAKLARQAALVYAMDAMLYATCGMVDRGDPDIMLETAACKVFCSSIGFAVIDDALQVMGGEGYMAENQLERAWRDARINIIVEGANEVMHSFVFAYGSKQLGEFMLRVRGNPLANAAAALRLGAELYLGLRSPAPVITRLHPRLEQLKRTFEGSVREFAHQVKLMLKTHRERLITDQLVQRRLSWCATWLHAMACSLARLDLSIRSGSNGEALADEVRIVEHICAMAHHEIGRNTRELRRSPDRTVHPCYEAAMRQVEALPNPDYVIPERTPDESARGKGRKPDQTHIPQFGSGSTVEAQNVPR